VINVVTQRLKITPCTESHFIDIYKYSQNEELYKYLEYNGFSDFQEFVSWLMRKLNSGVVLAIIELKSQTCIGTVSLGDINWSRRSCSLGYALNQDYVGRGYFSEALVCVLTKLKELGFHRTWAITQYNNLPSLKALERGGFIKEGELRDFYFDGVNFYDAVLMSYLFNLH
jgi:ribosomal-protein-alanine N-acetyltransferase